VNMGGSQAPPASASHTNLLRAAWLARCWAARGAAVTGSAPDAWAGWLHHACIAHHDNITTIGRGGGGAPREKGGVAGLAAFFSSSSCSATRQARSWLPAASASR
jgi:hypothetical protein